MLAQATRQAGAHVSYCGVVSSSAKLYCVGVALSPSAKAGVGFPTSEYRPTVMLLIGFNFMGLDNRSLENPSPWFEFQLIDMPLYVIKSDSPSQSKSAIAK